MMQTPGIPEGAIYNGRVFMDRIEQEYRESNHPISHLYAWQQLKDCFEHLVEHLREVHSHD